MTEPLPALMDFDSPSCARLIWTCLVEPGDEIAGQLTRVLGPVDALEVVRWTARRASMPARVHHWVAKLDSDLNGRKKAVRSIERWSTRLDALDFPAVLRSAASLNARFVTPEHDDWPRGLDDLADSAPIALWLRAQRADPLREFRRSIAVVGARASTGYGAMVASDLGADLVGLGFTVVSGGAFGIDVSAHRGALAAAQDATALPTIAVLAGGIDRLYPSGNESILRQIIAEGAVISESPPGFAPTRSRFLQRNRLIAAISNATIVVEAARRSGALNTASWAAALNRPLGAVPGPISSPNSAGCHHLLRELAATCITDASEASELARPICAEAAIGPHRQDATFDLPSNGANIESSSDTSETHAVLEALSERTFRDLKTVAVSSGLTQGEARSALGFLILQGRAEQAPHGWRRTSGHRGSPAGLPPTPGR